MSAPARFGYVDAQPVRDHVHVLVGTGMSIRQIALASGVLESSVHYIVNGRPSQKIAPARRVADKTAAALLSIRKEHAVMSALSDAVNNLRECAEAATNALDGDSNDAEHEALFELIGAAEAVVESWSK